MRAAVVYEPGGPDVLRVEDRTLPAVRPGWVVVRINAFGLNRSELVTRAGGSGSAVRFPRVIGLECAGAIVDSGASELPPGTTIIAAMGGIGRDFDGCYASHALLPVAQVVAVETMLTWSELAAVPETFGTAWGSLETLHLQRGQTVLIRGATSSVGMAAMSLAKDRGASVIATTRQERKRRALAANGADHVVLDSGSVASELRSLVPGGVDALLELVGPAVSADSFAALRPGARACLTGFLADEWDESRLAADAARLGIELLRYRSSSAIDAARYGDVFRSIVAGIETGRYRVNLDRTFPLEAIADAHRYMEANAATGKVVGIPAR